MNEEERYLFDLRGYLVIEEVLSPGEVENLNRLIDGQGLPEPQLDTMGARFGGFLGWDEAFCSLLDHERIMPYLKTILGDGFRLDHYYGIYMRAGTEQLRLHGGATPYDPPEFYHYNNGQMFNGLTVVSWNLTATGPGLGGFCAVPGSHKANFPCPDGIRTAHDAHEAVAIPDAPAGSVVIFTEALTHGTVAWSAEFHRRSLLYKYSPGQQSWSAKYAQAPQTVELTARQKLLFERPYFNSRPSLFGDE
ncbi:MAG: phytanoyl-CoA dioxygenase family protein [Caldilineaceae bacterium SB0661_bin_32]|uniref:Phytanoyl-CoA dioxygenase family protein n=1 Tax=Caldilineaceae bacterium SB0661_bin_32 TaxID=2605255 RepID=A0A6B1D962_9CHLR|nr:phytanoyl-CoA dioxygenase family protein [Caldilineaceae bacterium SB0661_bin_32]